MKLTLEVAKNMMKVNNGCLDLRGTAITELPDNLEVGGSLFLGGTGITELPNNLEVGCNLFLEGTGITELPLNLKVGGFILLPNGEVIQGEKLHLNTKEDIEMEI